MPDFEVESFEHVSATPGTVLLRVSGRWRSGQRERLSPPMLTVDDGRRTHRLAPLPGLDDAAPLAGPDAPSWRAAYSAPAELIASGRPAFALDAGGGLTDLPRPAAGRAVRPRTAPPAAPARVERKREDRRGAMRELQRSLDEERSARAEAERQARAERAAREQAEAAATAGSRERDALESRLAGLAAGRAEAQATAACGWSASATGWPPSWRRRRRASARSPRRLSARRPGSPRSGAGARPPRRAWESSSAPRPARRG